MSPSDSCTSTACGPSGAVGVDLGRSGAGLSGRGRPAPGRPRRFGLGAVGLALVLVLAGCGSSEEGGSAKSSASAGPGSTVVAEDDVQEPAPSPESSDAGSESPAASAEPTTNEKPETTPGGTGTGSIQIGDLSYELTVTRCTPLFGMVSGEAVSVAEPDNVEVDFEMPPNDWSDSKSIEMLGHSGLVELKIVDANLRWISGNHLFVEDKNMPSGVDVGDIVLTERNLSDDGQTMDGKGTFLEVDQRTMTASPNRIPTDDTPAETGTFSFSCPAGG